MDAEYAAYAAYDAAIATYGELEPCLTLRSAEARHIGVLKQLLTRYGGCYPHENPYLGEIQAAGTSVDAAERLAKREVEIAGLYKAIAEEVEPYRDVARVVWHLERESLQMHLPSLKLAAMSGGTLGPDGISDADGDESCPMWREMWGGHMGMHGPGGWSDCH